MKLLFAKYFGGVVAVCSLSSPLVAATPTFEHIRTIDYTDHCCLGNVMGMATAPNGSSLYFGDWYDDDIYYLASPLTSDGINNDILNTLEVADTVGSWATGGWSFQRADRDGNKIYLGGANATDTQLFVVEETAPGVSSTSQITGVQGIFSGPAVVGPNKLVMAGYATGALQFMTVSGTEATSDGLEIANPNVGTFKTLSVAYDATSGKIFAYMVDDNVTRRIDIFNSNGTPAGTSYVGTWIEGAPGTLSAAGAPTASSHNRSGQITINNEYRIMIVPFRDNAGSSDGWDIFDISTVGATGTPYLQIKQDSLPGSGYTGFERDITGSAAFSVGVDDYLALGYWNRISVMKVVTSKVSDWTLY